MSVRVVNLRELDLRAYDEGPEGHRFSLRGVGREHGSTLTGLTVYELEPGRATWPYHFELNKEEWLFVIEGELTVRTPKGERVMRAGELVCFPVGADGAHAVRNDSGATARFAMPSSATQQGDACVYPDTRTFKLNAPGFSFRGRLGEPVEYWDGVT